MAGLRKPLEALKRSAAELEEEALGVGLSRSGLGDEVDSLVERLDDLEARLDDRCSTMQEAASAVAKFNVRTLGSVSEGQAGEYLHVSNGSWDTSPGVWTQGVHF